MKKLNVRDIRKAKNQKIQMLTCYDFQMAQLYNEMEQLDIVLVGDSVGNVVLGLDTTVQVSLGDMITFGKAVRRGSPDKFLVIDLPFGTYSTIAQGLKCGTTLFQETNAEALKLEGAFPYQLKLIERLTQVGVAVMGHIGLTPQSVHQQGGYFTHGKTESEAARLMREAKALEAAGCFSIVLEFVEAELAGEISKAISIPTIGIGSGTKVDGQVLVINDLLKNGPKMPPKFCPPVTDLYATKKALIADYLKKQKA
ncbi:MAG: 3-methyl-2-oxobutanoate hydroxymethyltransferase [Bacteriovoracaceae bacterium]|jgi:3-methyl-2-oxobutanoate hydroxymethyltransferase